MEKQIADYKVYEDVRHVIYRFRFRDLSTMGLLPLRKTFPSICATDKSINPNRYGGAPHIITNYHCPRCSCLKMTIDSTWGMELELDRIIKDHMCEECMLALLRMDILGL